ncbi:uncharacterized protein BDV17DRAFT_294249 [Aspergillus undulatus]|uniref:uncharacterized protein n=1 Tax=Aspergillus undulatus TaxID=1810928 RepID=UPI003CCDA7A1
MAPAVSSINQQLSPLERRALIKQTEDVKGVMPIEDYLDRLDPYCSTTLKWPYPVTTQPASPPLVRQIESHREKVLSILDTHKFPPRRFLRFSVRYVEKPFYTSGLRQPILSLEYITDPFLRNAPKVPESLDPARDEIVRYLQEKGITIHVEIIFKNQAFNPTLFSIPSSAPEQESFDSSLQYIMRLLTSHLRLGCWEKVEICSLGLTVETAIPTIVVHVTPGARADWEGLAWKIRGCLPVGEWNGVEVEFVVGEVPREVVYPSKWQQDMEDMWPSPDEEGCEEREFDL